METYFGASTVLGRVGYECDISLICPSYETLPADSESWLLSRSPDLEDITLEDS